MAYRIGLAPFLSLLVAQIFLFSAWIVPLMFQSITSALHNGPNEQTRFLLWLGLPSASFFTLVPLWSDGGMVQWAMPGWLMLLPLLGAYLSQQNARSLWPKRWAIASTIVFVLFAMLACVEIQTGWLGQTFPRLLRKGDPTLEYVEWAPLASAVGEMPRDKGQKWFAMTPNWRDAAKIDQAFKGTLPVLVASDDPRNFALSVDASSLRGWNALIIGRTSQSPAAFAAIANCFSAAPPVSTIAIRRRITPEISLTIAIGTRFQPARCGRSTYWKALG
jgi:hypothetical protein